jgi:hypothetical protein
MKYVEDLKSNKVPWVLGRWPQTDQELWLFVKAVWGVEIPYRAICPGHVSPFQAFADAYFARHTMAIWEGSRGFSGKTFTLALLSCTEMLSLRCFVTILGGSAEQSLRVHEAMQTFLDSDNTPPSVKGLVDIMTRFDTRLLNGAKARTLMASQKSVRGPHPQRLRLDEVDEMDWELFKAAQGQPMRSRRVPNVETQTVASSTHQHLDGTMTKIKQEAKVKGWPLFRWCYKETSALAYGGWLQQDEIERKRHEISAEMWKMEYDLLEPNFEGRAIDALALERMFDPALGTYKGVPHRYHQFFDPRRDRDYITGVDWAKEKDFTVVWTWDATTLPWMCVAFQRFNRLPWPVILKMVNMRLARWGGKFIHDATGLGNVTSDLLVIPENMSPRDVKNQILAGRERSEILSEYVAAIENDSFKAPRILWAYDEHRFCNNDNLYGREHLPDSICAAALAWHMRKKSTRRSYIVEPDVTSDAVTRETGISPWKLV